MNDQAPLGVSGRIAAAFQGNALTPLLALVALLLGLFAVLVTPREEEPQINVTMANVLIPFPGASAKNVEQMVAAPAEQVIKADQLIDVTRFMNADGELEWDAPAGEWTILRIGYQPTGRSNHPASVGGRGLEIDKLSPDALDFYWEHVLDRVEDARVTDQRVQPGEQQMRLLAQFAGQHACPGLEILQLAA